MSAVSYLEGILSSLAQGTEEYSRINSYRQNLLLTPSEQYHVPVGIRDSVRALLETKYPTPSKDANKETDVDSLTNSFSNLGLDNHVRSVLANLDGAHVIMKTKERELTVIVETYQIDIKHYNEKVEEIRQKLSCLSGWTLKFVSQLTRKTSLCNSSSQWEILQGCAYPPDTMNGTAGVFALLRDMNTKVSKPCVLTCEHVMRGATRDDASDSDACVTFKDTVLDFAISFVSVQTY